MKRRGFEPQAPAASIAHIHIQIHKIESTKNCRLVQNAMRQREPKEGEKESLERDREPRRRKKKRERDTTALANRENRRHQSIHVG
eukprot:scaffold51164_cov28-Attheya_sp.AAC.1